MEINLAKVITVNGEALEYGSQPLSLRIALLDALGQFNVDLPYKIRRIALELFMVLADTYKTYNIDEFEYSLIKCYINATERTNAFKTAILESLNFE